MATRLPKVSVVLLNWNGVKDTLECIASLRKLTYGNCDVVVVDNGSEGNDLEVLRREASDCHIIANGNNDGFAEGNNVGMRFALAHGADYVLVLNNDVVVDPRLLDVLVDAAERDPSIGALAPRICLYDEPTRVVYPRAVDTWPLLLNFHLGTLGVLDRMTVKQRAGAVQVRSVDGCCFLARREALQKIGLLDPTYFIGGYESLCLSRRLLHQGYRMAASLDTSIWAKVSGSLGSRRKAALTYAFWGPRNRVVFARRYLAWPQHLLFLLEMPVHMLVWAIAWGRQARIAEKVPALLRGLWDGFRTDLRGSPDGYVPCPSRRRTRAPARCEPIMSTVPAVAPRSSLTEDVQGLRLFDRGVPWVKFKLDREMALLDRDVSEREGRILVDVGVGWGDYLHHYVSRGFKVIALDFQREDLGRIAMAGTENGSPSLIAGDANQLPLKDSQADVVFMCQVLEHLDDPSHGLREAHRVLKPGGYLFVDVPFLDQLYRPFSALALRLLQSLRATGSPSLLLRLLFRIRGNMVRERTYVKPLIALLRSLVPRFKSVRPDQFIEMYMTGELEGDYHRHFYFPGEWRDIIEKSGFKVEVVTGAWTTPPLLCRIGLFNRLFGLAEARLGDAALSRIGQILIVAATKR